MDCSICVTLWPQTQQFLNVCSQQPAECQDAKLPSVPSPLTLQQLGVVGVGEVEALQGAGDPGEVLPAARARRVQHRGAAGDLRDQHAPVPADMLCVGEIIFVHLELC